MRGEITVGIFLCLGLTLALVTVPAGAVTETLLGSDGSSRLELRPDETINQLSTPLQSRRAVVSRGAEFEFSPPPLDDETNRPTLPELDAMRFGTNLPGGGGDRAVQIHASKLDNTGGPRATSPTLGVTTEETKINLKVAFPAPEITEIEGGYRRVRVKGLKSYGDPGEPKLPLKTVRVLIPSDERVKGIRVSCGRRVALEGSYRVEPAQTPAPISARESAESEPTHPGEEVYSSPHPFPAKVYSNPFIQSKMGYRILILNLYPVSYVPAEGELSYFENITVELELGPSPLEGLSVRCSSEVRREIRRMVDNPEAIDSYLQKFGSFKDGDVYEYVIITSTNLKNYSGDYNWKLLCNAKESKRINTKIVTLDWIYAHYRGLDNPEKIRNFIVDAYENWGTEYVLLGGDDTVVPFRRFWVKAFDQDENRWFTANMPSDMYYSCLNGTFNYDNDNYWGEPTDGSDGGEVDFYAEVHVGRAPVASGADVSNFVRKTLAYESFIPENKYQAYMVGEYLDWDGLMDYAKPRLEEIRLGSGAYGYTTSGFKSCAWIETGTLYEKDSPWSKYDLIDVIDNGVRVLNHLGHGNPKFAMIRKSDLDSLSNTEYFFAYSQTCLAGRFDGTECWAEKAVKMEDGAAAVVMNARYGWGNADNTNGPSQHFAREFWDAAFGENKYNFGAMNSDSKEDQDWYISMSSRGRWCAYETNLFGDPELRFLNFPPAVGISPSVNRGLPGTTLDYIVRVWNENRTDNYNLTVSGTRNWDLNLSENLLGNMQPHEAREVILNVTIPSNADPNMEDEITIVATSQENAEIHYFSICTAYVVPVRFSPPHSDNGLDTDGDNLYNYLIVEVGVEADKAGWYRVSGDLYDITGCHITRVWVENHLEAGGQTLELRFDGYEIERSRGDGPYRVDLTLCDNNGNWLDGDEHETQPYSYENFQYPAKFAPPHSDYGLDTDSDNLYNYLVVEVRENVREAGEYQLDADLYDSDRHRISGKWTENYLEVGTQTIEVKFKGYVIRNFGENGPYRVDLDLEDENWNRLDRDVYWTDNYSWEDFQAPSPPTRDYSISAATYNWTEKVSDSDVADGDDVGIWVDLPFEFPFWGENKTEVGICSNGYLVFNPTPLEHDFSNSERKLMERCMIAPFWDDLRTDKDATDSLSPGVYVDKRAENMVISWEAARFGSSEDTIKFQTVLYSNGDIRINIDNVTNFNNFSPTLGLSNGNYWYYDVGENRGINKSWYFVLETVESPPEVLSASPSEWSWDPGTAYKITTTVRENNGLSDLDNVVVKAYAGDLTKDASDSERDHYTFWFDPADNSWHSSLGSEFISTANCSQPTDLSRRKGTYEFAVNLAKIAEPGNWDLYSKAVDSYDNKDSLENAEAVSVREYTEFSLDRNVLRFSGRQGETVVPENGPSILTTTTNENFDVQVWMSEPLTFDNYTIPIENVRVNGVSPSDEPRKIIDNVDYGENVAKELAWEISIPNDQEPGAYRAGFGVGVAHSQSGRGAGRLELVVVVENYTGGGFALTYPPDSDNLNLEVESLENVKIHIMNNLETSVTVGISDNAGDKILVSYPTDFDMSPGERKTVPLTIDPISGGDFDVTVCISARTPGGAGENIGGMYIPLRGHVAPEETTISVSPSTRTVRVSETFEENISVIPAEPIGGVSLNLNFDPSIIKAVEVEEGDLGLSLLVKEIDNENGIVTLAGTTTGGATVSDPGSFATIDFTSENLSEGKTSDLLIENLEVKTYEDGNVVPVPSRAENGEVTVIVRPPYFVDEDNVVGLSDLMTVAYHYGEAESSPNWLPAADVNDDGSVGLSDLMIVAYHYGKRWTEETENKITYTNGGYGFSFSYPSNWIIDNMESQGILMVFARENASEGRPNAGIQIYAGNLGIPPLDNVRGQIISGVENNENLTLTAGPEDVMIEDVPGLDFTLGVSNPQGNLRMRRVILKGENSGYDLGTIMMEENSWKKFKPDIEHMFDSFTFLSS